MRRRQLALTIIGIVVELAGLVGLAFVIVTDLTFPGRPTAVSARFLQHWHFLAAGVTTSAAGFTLIKPRWIGCIAPIVVAVLSCAAVVLLVVAIATSGR